jgi:hypothetical protein
MCNVLIKGSERMEGALILMKGNPEQQTTAGDQEKKIKAR